MGVGVRCFQCKEEVKGWNTGQKHGKCTGHNWQPGYYCTECKQTFQTHQLCQNHTEKVHNKNKNVPTVPPPLSAPAPSSSSASDRPPLIPSRPAPSAISVPRPDMSSLSGSGTLAGANLKASNGPPSSFQCTMCEPPGTFSSKESLEQHFARTSTCTKCSTHFYEPGKLQEHYRTSSAHPRCRECGDGFPGLNEWATHRARCPPPPPPSAVAKSTQNTSAPQSISDGFSFVSASVGRSDVVSRDGTALEPSELSSVAPSSPPLDPIAVGRDIDTVDDDMSDRISVSRDTAGTPVTENDDPDAHVAQDSSEPPKAVGKGKSKALSSNGAATPTTATTTLGGSQRIRTRTPTAKPLSFHCRSCFVDPCVKPVATLCGHIFCHSCIVRELATKMGCPVCQRPFLVRLHVGMGGS